jgi:simple sugar transport system substrate-binding protein
MRIRNTAAAGIAAMVAATLALTGCSSTGGAKATETSATASDGSASAGAGAGSGGTVATTPRYKVWFITHGAPGDTFWDTVRKGAEAAAAKDNIDLNYVANPDPAGQAQAVQQAVDAKVAGIAVTLAKPDAMKGAVQNAVKANIPVTGLNGGLDVWKSFGLKGYFGQDESVAGEAVGTKLNDEGSKHAICVIHEQGNVGLESRCAGIKKTFKGTVENLQVDGTNISGVQSAITAKLQASKDVDRIITLGAQFALAGVQSVKDAGSSAKIGTFDTNALLLSAIQAGTVEWAIDQQPYLQGYLAVDSLWLYLTNGDVVGGGLPVLTGPAFIDKTNVEALVKYAKAGTR